MKNLKENIEALNLHNKTTKDYYLKALEQATKLIGKKVCTAQQKAASAWNIDLPIVKKRINGNYLHIHSWTEFTSRSIWLNVKTCYNGGSHDNNTAFCIYIDTALYLGETEDGILKEMANESTQKSWIDTLKPVNQAKVLKDVEKFKAKKEEANKIYNSIPEHLRKFFYLNR